MLHYSTNLLCPYCAHAFKVCVHLESPPGAKAGFVANCPVNASPIQFTGRMLSAAEHCPADAVIGRPWQPDSPASAGMSSPTPRKWWEVWKERLPRSKDCYPVRLPGLS